MQSIGCPKHRLYQAYNQLLKMRGACAHEVLEGCNGDDVTVKQIEYLKLIDQHDRATFSDLARLTKNSKPTVTEMIHKCMEAGFVLREKSLDDARVSYLILTDTGKRLARSEQITLLKFMDMIMKALDDTEIETLTHLLEKVDQHTCEEV